MIKKRNLDPSLIQWIMSQTGLGPGIGEMFWVAPASSSSSQYRTQLQRWGVEQSYKIYTNPATAFAKMVASRNDVMLVMPGAYDLDAELAWSKSNTHLLGLGGPNIYGDYSEPNVYIYSDAITVASVITVTGNNCIMQNAGVGNFGANAACLTAFTLNSYGCHFKNMGFMGTTVTEQCAVAAAASLYIAGGGMYPVFEDCQIGQNVWGSRTTANSGVIRFSSTGSRPNGGIFRKCRVVSVGDDTACALVAIPAATSSGRGWLWDDCTFEHFDSVANGQQLARAFYSVGTSVQKQSMLLHNCGLFGVDEWQDADDVVVWSDMPTSSTSGGIGREPTAGIT